MSRRRYISTDISLDMAVDDLARNAGDFAALLYTWMIPHMDASGIVRGLPLEIRARVCPHRHDKTAEDIIAALVGMEYVGLGAWKHDLPGFEIYPAHYIGNSARLESRLRRLPWSRIAFRTRPVVLERDSYTCQQCGATERLEVDHIVPIAKGGGNDLENLQVLCRPCNRRKSAR